MTDEQDVVDWKSRALVAERELEEAKQGYADAYIAAERLERSLEQVRAAVIELVRLKDLKDTFPELLKQVDEHGYSMPYQQAAYEYDRCKPLAWAAARKALATQPPQPQQQNDQ